MKNENDFYLPPNASGEGKQPVILITQLMQQAKNMHHIDDLFYWLSTMMMQRLNFSIVQFWALQPYVSGLSMLEVRGIPNPSSAVPQQIYTNMQVASVIERLLIEGRGQMPLPVTNIFQPDQAQLLTQFNLNYWAGYFLKDDLLLPPAKSEPIQGKLAAPLKMLVSLYTEQSPSMQLLRATNFILEQAFRIATSRGFLVETAPTPPRPPLEKPSTTTPPTLAELIPFRTQNIEDLQMYNPFANAIIIPEKRARTLYAAIDGQKNISELALVTRLGQQEMVEALRYLTHHQRIEMHTRDRKPVDSTLFF